jgi:hypothetical protein
MSAYHEGFWIAITAAAPVIALAHVVALKDVVAMCLTTQRLSSVQLAVGSNCGTS